MKKSFSLILLLSFFMSQTTLAMGNSFVSVMKFVGSEGLNYGKAFLKFGKNQAIPGYSWPILISGSFGLSYGFYYKLLHKKELKIAKIQKEVKFKLEILSERKKMLDEELEDCGRENKIKEYLSPANKQLLKQKSYLIVKEINRLKMEKEQIISEAAEAAEKILNDSTNLKTRIAGTASSALSAFINNFSLVPYLQAARAA